MSRKHGAVGVVVMAQPRLSLNVCIQSERLFRLHVLSWGLSLLLSTLALMTRDAISADPLSSLCLVGAVIRLHYQVLVVARDGTLAVVGVMLFLLSFIQYTRREELDAGNAPKNREMRGGRSKSFISIEGELKACIDTRKYAGAFRRHWASLPTTQRSLAGCICAIHPESL